MSRVVVAIVAGFPPGVAAAAAAQIEHLGELLPGAVTVECLAYFASHRCVVYRRRQ